MKINTNEMLSAIQKCMPGVESGNALIVGADTLTFANGNVHSYNDTITVSAPLTIEDGELSGSVKAVDLFKLISKIKDPTFELEITEAEWTVTFGTAEATLPNVEASISGHIEKLGLETIEWKELVEDFMEGVRLCKMASNQAPISGIYVDGDVVASSDGQRLNKFMMAGEMDTFFIDDRVASEFMKLTKITDYNVSDSWIHMKLEDNTVFSAKMKDASQFPIDRINTLFAEHAFSEGDVRNKLPAQLAEVIDRVAVFAAEIKGSMAVNLELTQEELIVTTHRDSGKMKERIKWEEAFAVDPAINIWVSSTFLVEACGKVMEFYLKEVPAKVEGQPDTVALVFDSENYRQVTATYKKA